MKNFDTITAFCTAPGGALAIIRISGPRALEASGKVWRSSGKPLSAEHPRILTFGHVLKTDGSEGETCLAVYMPAPHSYTGEDVVELQCHGGIFSPRSLLSALLKCGVEGIRMAEPGEFTRRAFLNGKMDLTQAEAVADIISAKTESAFHLAERQLSGALGKRTDEACEKLYRLLAEMESRLDFPEENLDWVPVEELIRRIRDVQEIVRRLLADRDRGAVIRSGVRLVIAGAPNVGKSSLLNTLLGYDRAIVSDIPGTTRDTLCETASLRGISVELTDTAGIRENVADSVEGLGVARSKKSLKIAGIVFWVMDSTVPDFSAALDAVKKEVPSGMNIILIWNKSDLAPAGFKPPETGYPSVLVSAVTQDGIPELLDLFEKTVWGSSDKSEPECAVSERHAVALERAAAELEKAIDETRLEEFELAAENIRQARSALASISGETTAPDILDDIFSRFCIGK